MENDLKYNIIRRDVKNVRLRVSEDGTVYVYAPMHFSDEDINSIIEKKSRWIDSKYEFFKKKKTILLNRNEILLFGSRYTYYYSTRYENKVVINHESKTIQAKRDLLNVNIQDKWLKSVAKRHITNRLYTLSESLLLPYNKLYIRSQKKKWGNCSKEKNISINWRIIKAPQFVIDYIIIHELCHTIIMNHTAKFKTLLRSHCPDCDQAQNWLDKYGNSL